MRTTTTTLATVLLAAGTMTASAASIDKSVDVKAPPAKVWAMIGPFCAISKWHPAIGKCTEKGKVRTLVTKDGKMTFVEKQTAHSKKEMMYSYEIEKSPLPISDYKSTIKVTPGASGGSTVDWSATYTPASGKESDADTALTGIYQSGLDNIQKMGGM